MIRSSLISSKIAGSSIVGGILYSTLSAIFLIVPLKILPDLVFGSLLITIAILGYIFFKQTLAWQAILGLFLIVIGVILVNSFSVKFN